MLSKIRQSWNKTDKYCLISLTCSISSSPAGRSREYNVAVGAGERGDGKVREFWRSGVQYFDCC